jgi:outer membrane protein TolC
MRTTRRRFARRFHSSIAALAAALIAAATPAPRARAQTAAPRDSAAPLLLSQLFARIDSASPRVLAARAMTRAADARIDGASRPPDPMLQLAIMNRSLPGLEPMPITGMTQLQLTQMLPIAGQLGLAKESGRALAEASSARAVEVRWESRARSAALFYDLYATTQSLRIARESRDLLRELGRSAETMYSVGRGRQADVLRAQVEVARMTEDIVRMRSMRTVLIARLDAQVDTSLVDSATGIARPVFPPTLPPLDSLVARAMADRGMMRAARSEAQAAGASVELAHRSIWPDLEVGVQFAWQGNGTGGTVYMGGLMIGASLPVFAGSRQMRARDEAGAMEQAAHADLREVAAETRSRVTELYSDVQRARRLDALYRATILPQAEAALGAALSSYRAGSVDFMTLVESQMTLNKYRQELFTLEAQQGMALAELEMMIGQQLVDPATSAGVAREETER